MSIFAGGRIFPGVPESSPEHPSNLSPEQRRQRFAREFDERTAGVEPYPKRAKSPNELEADARLEQRARADEARDLSPQVWPRR